ncbi:hypothetical protein B2G71_22165 [Novosphingobium sp. PC22D]|nr:hypothetical protein B2G71_22165 [Novosphingobium sp. PC22D]
MVLVSLCALALGGCADHARERELAEQLAAAKQEAREANAAAERAQREAEKAQAASDRSALAEFYNSEGDTEPYDPAPEENADGDEAMGSSPEVDVSSAEVGMLTAPGGDTGAYTES